jgi:anti-sigma factor RsiW
MTCTEIDPLVTPYVDEEISPDDRRAVETHLTACAPCRSRVSGERAARELVRARGDALTTAGGRAPASLRARVAAAAPRARRRRFVVPVPVAAMLALTVLGVFVHRTAPVIAAQLTLDHVKCLELRATRLQPAAPREVEAAFRQDYGWDLRVPEVARLRFVGARRCLVTEGRMAHLHYEYAGRPVSLFIIPGAAHATRASRAFGRSAVIWSRAGSTYALVGAMPTAELQQIAGVIH